MPAHALVSKPGTKSPSGGTSGSAGNRAVAVTAKGRSLPALICSMEEGMLSNMTCTCPPMRSGQRRGRSPIRDMQHVDAGHHFEQLAGHVRDGTVARRSKTDLARMGLSVGDELGDRLGRK